MILLLTPLLAVVLLTLLVCRWIDRRYPPQWTSMHELARLVRQQRQQAQRQPADGTAPAATR